MLPAPPADAIRYAKEAKRELATFADAKVPERVCGKDGNSYPAR